MNLLKVERLSVKSEGNVIIKNISIEVQEGEVVALVGPNGSGKSTICNAIAGKKYEIDGSIIFKEEEISKTGADERAIKGIFLVHQNLPLLDGIRLSTLLNWLAEVHGEEIIKKAEMNVEVVGLERKVFKKDIAKLSGGERKRVEMLLMLSLPSKFIIIDELDSGLDVDGVKIASKIIADMKKQGKGVLIVSHYPFVLEEINPDKIYLVEDGEIKKQGGMELIQEIKDKGYGDNNEDEC